jgi:hypothetical protein
MIATYSRQWEPENRLGSWGLEDSQWLRVGVERNVLNLQPPVGAGKPPGGKPGTALWVSDLKALGCALQTYSYQWDADRWGMRGLQRDQRTDESISSYLERTATGGTGSSGRSARSARNCNIVSVLRGCCGRL